MTLTCMAIDQRGHATIGVMTMIKNFLRDESGASAAEYALILAIVGAAIVTGALALGQAVGDELEAKADCVENPGTANANCA